MKFIKRILKIIGITLAIVAGLFIALVIVAAISTSGDTNKKAAVYTVTPELLIIPATATPTREPSPTPYGNDIYITLTAFAVAPPPTPTARSVRNAAVPIYDGNNNLIGYLGEEPTATPFYAAPAQAACLKIKGNVNWDGERIYHCPSWRDYDKTTVVPGEGDQYFCTEAEAIAAGFRAAGYAHGACW